MKFLRILIIACVFISGIERKSCNAQEEKRFWDRVYIGGNFGLQFGDYTTVYLAPQFGYRITDKLLGGIGVTYIYLKYKDPVYNYTFSTNVYGGSVFARYLILENIFLHTELEQLNMDDYDYFLNRKTRIWVPALLVGGGLRQPMGEHSSVQLLLLYDVIQDRHSIYQNPIIRVGFGFGF